MRNSVNVYVVLDCWARKGDKVSFITTDYDEIRAWAEEINYTYEDDYWVEEVSLPKSDVQAMAGRLKRY